MNCKTEYVLFVYVDRYTLVEFHWDCGLLESSARWGGTSIAHSCVSHLAGACGCPEYMPRATCYPPVAAVAAPPSPALCRLWSELGLGVENSGSWFGGRTVALGRWSSVASGLSPWRDRARGGSRAGPKGKAVLRECPGLLCDCFLRQGLAV